MKRADVIAGLSVAGLLLPEAVAYAAIAGLPVARAVAAAVIGCLVYALAGQSRFAIVAPTSSSAAIIAAMLAGLPLAAEDKAVAATAAVLVVGGLFVLAAALRLGGLTSLISRPVLRGFAFGIAVTIILRQVPVLVGAGGQADTLWALLRATFAASWNPWSYGPGTAALLVMLVLRQVRALPGALIVLAGGVAASWGLNLAGHGVAMVGAIAFAPDGVSLPLLPRAEWSGLVPYVLPLALILFAESWGTINGLAVAHGDRVRPNRELTALGLANLASALLKGMPVGAGFSAGSAAEAAGAKGRATAMVAAVTLAALVWAAAPLMAWLPAPVLAAVVIAVLAHAMHPAPFLRLWHLQRDFAIAVLAAVAVLAFGVLNGMLIAVAVSIATLLRRLATPRVAALGQLPGSRAFVDLARHPDAQVPDNMTVWRPSEPLFFGNAAAILGQVRSAARGRALVLSLEECFDLDSTALDELLALDQMLARAGVQMHLARVHDHVRDVLALADATGLLARSRYSVDEAVIAAQAALAVA